MPRRLFYGSFEEILRLYITPEMTRKKLADLLLSAPLVDANAADKEYQRSVHEIDSGRLAKYCSGERGISSAILENFSKPNAEEYVQRCFSVEIIPCIINGNKEKMVTALSDLICADDSLEETTKTYFTKCASEKELDVFLSEVYIYAVNRKKAAQKPSNLPMQNRFFHGRGKLLEEIEGRYQNGVHALGLYGMGGVGKTQLALEYAHQHIRDYETIWWINAENKTVLQKSISALLSAQKSLPKGRDAEGIRQAFLEYLDKNQNWLLIYDNAEYGTTEEYQTLTEYFPQNHLKGNILLTTRCKNPFEGIAHIEVPIFSEEEASRFLQQRSQLEDEENAAVLAAQLGFLPLALEYAAAYIRETPDVDFTAYSKKLEHYGVKVLDRKVGQLTYKNTVRQAFHITLDRILEDSAENYISGSAEQFLYICAFLAPDGIEIEVFARYGGGLPEPIRTVMENELDRDELVRNLTRYSLVQVEQGMMSIHRLLQEVLRDELVPEVEILCINYAYGLFYNIFYSLREVPIKEARPLLLSSVPHIQSILCQYVRRYKNKNQGIPDSVMVAKEYFSWTGLLLSDMKHLDENEAVSACGHDIPILEAAVDFYDMMPGGRTIYQGFVLLLLAQDYAKLGDTSSAVKQYLRALAITDKVIDSLPTEIDSCQPGTVEGMYYEEAFQLASDICAAIGSSGIVSLSAALLWSNLKTLMGIVRKKMLCFPRRDDAQKYKEPALFLQIFSCQVANHTQRAFILHLDAPEGWKTERKQQHLDGPFGFFFPSLENHCEVSADTLKGFDILLESQKASEIAEAFHRPWITLAFPQHIKTLPDMLSFLTGIDTGKTDTHTKHTLYSLIYQLSSQLQREDVMKRYGDILKSDLFPTYPQ